MVFVVGDRVLPFPSESFLLGSGAGCALRLSQLEPQQAEVFLEDGAWHIRDISGTSSLRVNGLSILEGKIEDGSQLNIGSLKLTVRVRPENAPLEDQTFIPTGGSILANGLVIDRRYQILGKIAAGGMGAVYLVEHLELGKKFAMKVMLPELSRDPDFVNRFKREAMASSRIGHQNIVAISDFGRTQDGRFYFVMEYLDGATLAELVRNEGALPGERVIGIALQMGRALATAHATGIIHRDLKPENIMLVQQLGRPDFVKVLDFGVAKVSSASGSEGKTAIGMVIGTPQYMSPEQAAGMSVDARTDIYAMGLILYELVTGRPAFKAETPSMLLAMQMTAKQQPFAPGPIEETPELEELVHAMLAKKPSGRPDSMDAVLNRLEALPLDGSAKKGATTRLGPPTLPQAAITIAAPRTIEQPTGIETQEYRVAQTATPLPSKTEFSPRMPAATAVAPALARAEKRADHQEEPSLEELAIPRRSKWPLLLVAAVIVGVGGSYAWMSRRALLGAGQVPAKVATPQEVEIPEKVEVAAPLPPGINAALTFDTTPPGAEVYDGDFLLGVTPFTLQRDRGVVVELRFVMKDYVPQVRKVRFEDTARVSIALERSGEAAAPGDKAAQNEKAPTSGKTSDSQAAAAAKAEAPAKEKRVAKEKPAAKEPAAKEKPAAKEPAPRARPGAKEKPGATPSSELKDLPF